MKKIVISISLLIIIGCNGNKSNEAKNNKANNIYKYQLKSPKIYIEKNKTISPPILPNIY